jgi:hypothetical protein
MNQIQRDNVEEPARSRVDVASHGDGESDLSEIVDDSHVADVSSMDDRRWCNVIDQRQTGAMNATVGVSEDDDS